MGNTVPSKTNCIRVNGIMHLKFSAWCLTYMYILERFCFDYYYMYALYNHIIHQPSLSPYLFIEHLLYLKCCSRPKAYIHTYTHAYMSGFQLFHFCFVFCGCLAFIELIFPPRERHKNHTRIINYLE